MTDYQPTPERLASIRGRYWDDLSSADVTDLWDHIDAQAAKLDTVRKILDRLETAESLTVAQPCKLTHTPPFDFGECETHDRTFPLGGTCDYAGKSVVEYLDEREQEQRGRAVVAEMRAEAAEATVARIVDLLNWGESGDLDYIHVRTLTEALEGSHE